MKTITYSALFGAALLSLISLALWAQGINPLLLVAVSVAALAGGLGMVAALVLAIESARATKHVIVYTVTRLRTAMESR